MLSSLCWVPRGAPVTKLPAGVDHSDDKDNEDDTMDTSNNSPTREDIDHSKEEKEEEVDAEDAEDAEEGSEVDIDEVLANELDTLAFYKNGEKDPYMKSNVDAQNVFDEDELDDLNMRPTDSLIVSVKSGEDASSLEVHVFDDDPDDSDGEEGPYVPHTYVHHDIVLPALPLCTAYTRLIVGEDEKEAANLVAVGMFTPGIDVWDVDRVNNLEPVTTLGGYDVSATMTTAIAAARNARRGGKARRKRKPKPRLVEGSHRDAVLALSWNNVQREYLASGSADSTIKVWDIESSHCACTLSNHHSDKVQAVEFHPSEAHLLASGSFDKTVMVGDVRATGDLKPPGSWSVTADVETVQWGTHCTDGMVIATTEDGNAFVIDPRKSGTDAILKKWKVHDGAATACSVSSHVSGLVVSAGVDKTVKVWDLRSVREGDATPDVVYEQQSKAGSIFSLSLCDLPKTESNASPFVVAYGGSKGTLTVVDLAVESRAVRDRFFDQCCSTAAKAIESRAIRCEKARLRKNAQRVTNSNDNDDMNDASGDENDDEEDMESDMSQSEDGDGD